MIKTAVINMMKCSDHSIIASNRIAKYLSLKMKCILIDRKEAIPHFNFERVFVVNGPTLFCNFRDDLKKLVENAKEVVWIQNDYAITIPKFVKDKKPIMWSACENLTGATEYAYVNWNQLTYTEGLGFGEPRYKGLCYYGAFRAGRKRYFEKYLSSDRYPVYISTSKSGKNDFKQIARGAQFFEATELVPTLAQFQSSLYIEDEATHDQYHSPANRFYEALSARVLQLFDYTCLNTFTKADIDISPWVVAGPQQYAEALLQSEELRRSQLLALTAVDYRSILDAQLDAAVRTLK